MKSFQFSLETLLSLRQETEQEKRIILAQKVGVLNQIEQRLQEAENRVNAAFQEESGTLEMLQLRERVMNRSASERRTLEQPRQSALQEVEKARGAYAQARAASAALERLKEKRKEEWAKEAKRQEILRIDEVARGSRARGALKGGVE
ncbi:MAG: flagellar FliJ family protein [Spirochaetales bacterium]|nr:flagellar FliJ family protein [Spirochaetales bacterium]